MRSRRRSLRPWAGRSDQGSPVHARNWIRGQSPICVKPNSGSDPELMQVRFLEEVTAVGGLDADFGGLAAARDLERDDGAGGAEAPDAAPEVGEAGGLLA